MIDRTYTNVNYNDMTIATIITSAEGGYVFWFGLFVCLSDN